MKSPAVYDYTDYLEFLQDWFRWQKENNKQFSFQYFANKAGIKSRSFMQFVLKGERALNSKNYFKVAQGLGLSNKETQYFEAMVLFKHAKDLEQRNFLFEKLQKLGKSSQSVQLQQKEFDFFKHWYIAPIREIICNTDFKEDYQQLASYLSPKITAKEAKSAVDLLMELGLVEKTSEGYEATALHLQGSDLVRSLALRNFQKKTAELASNSLDLHAKEERNISTISLSTTKDGFDEMQELISDFQQDVVKIVEKYEGAERAYQLNVQLFPLTRDFSKE